MARRVDSELLLVGSLPADSAESALRSAASFFGDLVFALPDGETGPRAKRTFFTASHLRGLAQRSASIFKTHRSLIRNCD